MLFMEIIAVYSENHTKTINIFRGKNEEWVISLLKQVVHMANNGL
jgi:hypothetical protein